MRGLLKAIKAHGLDWSGATCLVDIVMVPLVVEDASHAGTQLPMLVPSRAQASSSCWSGRQHRISPHKKVCKAIGNLLNFNVFFSEEGALRTRAPM